MKSLSGRPSGTDSQVEHLSSTAASRIEDTKRRFVVELFVRRGEFWDMVCGLRHKYGIRPRVGLPNDESGMPLLPEDRPRHRPTSPVVNTRHPERREQIDLHNRRAQEFEHAWFQDLDRIVHERVPKELRKSSGSSVSVIGLSAGSSRLSNEYGFWVWFVSICVLYDPPETELVEFADFARARPYRVSPAGSSENKTIAMQTPPVAALADPADERELVMSEVNLILDEINRLYLQPRGLDIHDMWRDVLRSSPNIATQIWYKEELLQRRLYIEVDESTTDQDVRAALRLIRAKLKKDRWLVPGAADAATREAIINARESLPPRVKSTRDPLLALQCATLYDRYNQPDPADKRVRRWSYKRLAAHFGLRSARAAREHVTTGRKLLEKIR
jgi:hypothetical protein